MATNKKKVVDIDIDDDIDNNIIYVSESFFEQSISKEHCEDVHCWIRCQVLLWNSKGQPLVVRDSMEGKDKPIYIWPLGLIRDYERTEGFRLRQQFLKKHEKES